MVKPVEFACNQRQVRLETDDERMLLWVLRSDLGLTGTKYGCGETYCGACTVVLDGKAVRSCQTPLKDVAGKHVLTIEGLEKDGALHPLQKAFVEESAFQCGYCTPGMIMSAYAFLAAHPAPTEADIVSAMEGNLCRCASHQRIIAAIRSAAGAMKGGAR